jgi:hypothetical protein
MVERRHAAVVQVGKVGPDSGERRGSIALAALERTFRRERAVVERGGESVRHDVEPRSIRTHVREHARPCDVAAAVVRAVAARAPDVGRIKQLAAARRQRRVHVVRIPRWPEPADDRFELALDARHDHLHERVVTRFAVVEQDEREQRVRL